MLHQSWDVEVPAVDQPPRREGPRRRRLQDDGMTMTELAELVYKLVKHEELPFFDSDGRFRPRKIYRRIFKPTRRPAIVEGGRAANREASHIRGISSDAGRIHR
jgi:hypothetical protein